MAGKRDGGAACAAPDLGRLPHSVELARDAAGRPVLRYLDERRLPAEAVFEQTGDWRAVIDAVKVLAVRGAPALGVSGAAALALWAANGPKGAAGAEGAGAAADAFGAGLAVAAREIAAARPTAVNLGWGVGRALSEAQGWLARGASPAQVAEALFDLVKRMEAEDEAVNRAIGENGAGLFAPASRILTHCNAGSLGCVFYGTALGAVYAAAAQGRVARVYADETRPLGQGARLTTWELSQVGIPVTLICDNMAASLMAQGEVDAVIVGADRIARNGDVANKIGTYGVAVLARHHGIPFYVAAPSSTFDASLATGVGIPIEQRDPAEVAAVLPEGVEVWNPAFDVTPADLVTAIVTEHGVFAPAEAAAAVEAMKG